MILVNLTGNPVVLTDRDGKRLLTIPGVAGRSATLCDSPCQTPPISVGRSEIETLGVTVYPYGLPDPRPDTLFIVPRHVHEHVVTHSARTDTAYLGSVVLDPIGQVIGHYRLHRVLTGEPT